MRRLLVGGVGLLVLGWCCSRPVLRGTARAWVVADEFTTAEVVALSDGARLPMRDRSVEWLRAGNVQRMVLLRSETRPTDRAGITPPMLQGRLQSLRETGVPESAVVLVGEELATMHSGMVALLGWAKSNRVTEVVLPTEPFATRRRAWLARRLLQPAGVRATVVPVALPEYAVDEWWRTKEGLLDFEQECVLMLYYWCRY